MKLMNLRLGCNDLAKARTFYDATFGALGVERAPMPEEYPIAMYKLPGGPNFVVGPARDGNPATHANGGTILFGMACGGHGKWRQLRRPTRTQTAGTRILWRLFARSGRQQAGGVLQPQPRLSGVAVAVRPDGSRHPISREWVPEVPVALEFNGLSYAVMMATPADLADFATGFALAEGLIGQADQVTDLAIAEVEHGWIVRATLAGLGAEQLGERVRTRVAESSCGLCGIENLEALAKPLPPIVNGYRPLLEGPGLGITINEKAVKKHPFQQEVLQREFSRDGAVADW